MEQKRTTQNDAPFVAFQGMSAVMFVLPDEVADGSIAGLQWFILIPTLNHTGSHRSTDSYFKPYSHREKKGNIWNKNHQLAAILGITRKSTIRLILVAFYDIL